MFGKKGAPYFSIANLAGILAVAYSDDVPLEVVYLLPTLPILNGGVALKNMLGNEGSLSKVFGAVAAVVAFSPILPWLFLTQIASAEITIPSRYGGTQSLDSFLWWATGLAALYLVQPLNIASWVTNKNNSLKPA